MSASCSVLVLPQGFLELRLEPWLRNFLTRCLAIIPSLIVALIGGSAGAGKLIIIASVYIAPLSQIQTLNHINILNMKTSFLFADDLIL